MFSLLFNVLQSCIADDLIYITYFNNDKLSSLSISTEQKLENNEYKIKSRVPMRLECDRCLINDNKLLVGINFDYNVFLHDLVEQFP